MSAATNVTHLLWGRWIEVRRDANDWPLDAEVARPDSPAGSDT